MPVEHLVFHPSKEGLHDAIVEQLPFPDSGLNDFVILSACLKYVLTATLDQSGKIRPSTEGNFVKAPDNILSGSVPLALLR